MPPKHKVSREDIVAAGLELVRQKGPQGLNARAVAAHLGVSTQPIFSHYTDMEALRSDVLGAAYALYQSFLRQDMARPDMPAYKGSGMAYIRFAREEPELFKLLCMRDRTGEPIDAQDDREIAPMLAMIQEKLGLDAKRARLFHSEMWVFVHGLATMIATGYLTWTPDYCSAMLTDLFQCLSRHYLEHKEAIS